MAEILPRHYIVAIIFFVFVILSGIYLVNEMIADKPDFLDSNDADEFLKFNESFNKLEDINKSVSNIRENIEGADTDLGIFGVLNSLINSAWNTVGLLFQSLSFMNSAFYALENIFGIPGWVPTLIILVFIIIIAFGIYKMIFKAEV